MADAKKETAAEWVPRGSVVPWKRNPRKNDAAVAQVAAAIRQWGWGAPIVARAATRQVIAGHTRLKAAELLGLDMIPVRFVDVDERTAELMALADNKLGEIAEWDDPLLLQILSDYGLDDAALAGWDGADLDKMAADLTGGTQEAPDAPDQNAAADLARRWGVKPGQLWRLGRHRILCGDALAAPADFGASCSTLLFDPEWDSMPTMSARASTLAFCDGQRAADVIRLFGPPAWVFAWDCVSSWYTPNRPLRRMKLCLWYGDLATYNQDGAHYGDAGKEREVFNSRGSYTFKPDPRGKHLSDVFSLPITKLHSESEHAHSKPLDWIRMLIGNCSSGDVFDPYLGSGTSLIACEQLGRTCVGIELDAGHVALALQWWSEMTGNTPEVDHAS